MPLFLPVVGLLGLVVPVAAGVGVTTKIGLREGVGAGARDGRVGTGPGALVGTKTGNGVGCGPVGSGAGVGGGAGAAVGSGIPETGEGVGGGGVGGGVSGATGTGVIGGEAGTPHIQSPIKPARNPHWSRGTAPV